MLNNPPWHQKKRSGAARRLALLVLASLFLIGGLGYLALQIRPGARRSPHSQQGVRIYCASGLVKPVEAIANAYQKEYGTKVEIVRTGGSGALAGQIKTEFETGMAVGADIFVSADENLLNALHAEQIVQERFPIAQQVPVVAVPAGSSLDIKSFHDLLQQKGLRFGIASDGAAVGQLTRKIAQRDGLLEALETNKATDVENVMALAQALVAGSLDAAIIWDTVVSQVNQQAGKPTLKIACPLDPQNKSASHIALGILAKSPKATESLRFARYLTSPEKGKPAFEQLGYTFLDGDPWEETPEIHLYCGSMFTPVLEEAVRDFAEREGVRIYPRWEGCGKLVASMKALDDPELFPDAYLACDIMFLDAVQDHFGPPTTISQNKIVIAVNRQIEPPIEGPDDLIQRGLRIGICDPDQSALGRLTQKLLSEEPYEGRYEKMRREAAVTVDVGPTLVSQLLAGGLDAAFVYRSNVLANPKTKDVLYMVELDDRSAAALATQPWAVSRSTRNRALLHRLYEWIERAEIRQDFEQHGFELR